MRWELKVVLVCHGTHLISAPIVFFAEVVHVIPIFVLDLEFHIPAHIAAASHALPILAMAMLFGSDERVESLGFVCIFAMISINLELSTAGYRHAWEVDIADLNSISQDLSIRSAAGRNGAAVGVLEALDNGVFLSEELDIGGGSSRTRHAAGLAEAPWVFLNKPNWLALLSVNQLVGATLLETSERGRDQTVNTVGILVHDKGTLLRRVVIKCSGHEEFLVIII